jgi:hypothetical protein
MSNLSQKYLQPADRIVGIHNYCDAWCQRCAFTARCAVFYAQQASDRGPKSRDMANKEFWDRLHETMSDTLEMVRERCVEMGIDPDNPLTPEEEAERQRLDEKVDAHELVRLAGDYMMSVKRWFDATEPMLKAKEDELNLRARLDLPGAPAPGPEAAELTELLEVVQWYYTLIPPKVARAVSGLVEGEPECADGFPRDSDGSAKVALISIERSMAAWTKLRSHLPEQSDVILDMLVALDRLRRGLDRDFPNARAFVRPGFDEPAAAAAGKP